MIPGQIVCIKPDMLGVILSINNTTCRVALTNTEIIPCSCDDLIVLFNVPNDIQELFNRLFAYYTELEEIDTQINSLRQKRSAIKTKINSHHFKLDALYKKRLAEQSNFETNPDIPDYEKTKLRAAKSAGTLIHYVPDPYMADIGDFYYDSRDFRTVCLGGERDCLVYCGDGDNIIIPTGIKTCMNMFKDYRNLTEMPKIPDSVVSGEYMFADCENLTYVSEMTDSITNCDGMFLGCTNLKTVAHISDNATSCSHMFDGCSSLVSVPAIPDSVTDCSFMFADCDNLVTPPAIPDSVTNCNCMFSYCTSLSEAPEIPGCVKYTSSMFRNCSTAVQEQGEYNIANRF